MNDVKNELLKTIGDVSRSKKHVMDAVERELKPKPVKPKRSFVPMIVAAIVMIALFLTLPRLLEQEVVEQSPSFQAPGEEVYEFYRIHYETYMGNDEFSTSLSNNAYAEDVAMSAYAFDNDIEVSDEELSAAHDRYYDVPLVEEQKALLKKALSAHGLTWEDYEQHIETYKIPMNALKQKLLAPYEKKYSNFESDTHQMMLEQAIYKNFELNHTEMYNDLMQQYKFTTSIYGGVYAAAVVISVNDQAIQVAEGYKTLDKRKIIGVKDEDATPYIYWIPNIADFDVAVGDRLSIGYSSSYANSDAEKRGKYSPVTNALSLSILTDKTLTIELADNEHLQKLADAIDWNNEKIEMVGDPEYRFTDGVNRYDAWRTNDKLMLIVRDLQQNRVAKIPIEQVSEWLVAIYR